MSLTATNVELASNKIDQPLLDTKRGEGISIYQVYPRSFFDLSGNGVGDLAGIKSKLAYVASLGVDFIWIGPFYRSPMKDFGYDVSDYCAVDPLFGTIDDFKALIAEAEKLRLKVMLDMVLSHSSNQHPWFIKSASDRHNPKHDWYVWVDGDNPEQPPNNWLSVFGNSAWEYHKGRGQFYLHNFLKEQPDLNFHNPEVQAAMLDVCKFWLDLGVKGLRLDTVNFYFHNQQLKDNPLIEDQTLAVTDAPDCNPYTRQVHLYDKNQPENIQFLKQLRKLADNYDCVLLGEVGETGQATAKIIKAYTAGEDLLQLCYGFDFIGGSFTAEHYHQTITNFWQEAKGGMICNSFGNHDAKRFISRWSHNKNYEANFARLCCTLLMFIKGSQCIYQGEELGLSEYDISLEEIQDPYGKAFYPEYKGRDGARTPMVWDQAQSNAGFSQAKKTWLPIPADHLPKAVSAQEKEAKSLLNFYRQMLKFKKMHPALNFGQITTEIIAPNLLKISRYQTGEKICGYFNFSDQKINLPAIKERAIAKEPWLQDASITDVLKPYGFLITS